MNEIDALVVPSPPAAAPGALEQKKELLSHFVAAQLVGAKTIRSHSDSPSAYKERTAFLVPHQRLVVYAHRDVAFFAAQYCVIGVVTFDVEALRADVDPSETTHHWHWGVGPYLHIASGSSGSLNPDADIVALQSSVGLDAGRSWTVACSSSRDVDVLKAIAWKSRGFDFIDAIQLFWSDYLVLGLRFQAELPEVHPRSWIADTTRVVSTLLDRPFSSATSAISARLYGRPVVSGCAPGGVLLKPDTKCHHRLCTKLAPFSCGRCRGARYCGREHQRLDWNFVRAPGTPLAPHRTHFCDELAARRGPNPTRSPLSLARFGQFSDYDASFCVDSGPDWTSRRVHNTTVSVMKEQTAYALVCWRPTSRTIHNCLQLVRTEEWHRRCTERQDFLRERSQNSQRRDEEERKVSDASTAELVAHFRVLEEQSKALEEETKALKAKTKAAQRRLAVALDESGQASNRAALILKRRGLTLNQLRLGERMFLS